MIRETNNQQLATRANEEILDVSTAQLPVVAKQANPFMVAHGLLRGRYPLAITLGLIGLLAGGGVGFKLKKPQYQSIGVVRISPVLPKLLFNTPENTVMPMFDSFVATQAELLRSRRIIDEAMAYPPWKELGRMYTPDAVADFEENLRVDPLKGAALIRVAFTDEDPKAAAVAVKGVIDSYQRLYDDTEAEGGGSRIERLDQLVKKYTLDIGSKNDAILLLSNGFGPSFLEQIYDANLGAFTKLGSDLFETQREIARAGGVDDGGVAATKPSTAPAPELAAPPPLEALALRDLSLQNMRAERVKVDVQLRLDAGRLGENHPAVQEARRKLALLDEQVKDRVAELLRAGLGPQAPVQSGGQQQLSLPQLYADLAILRRRQDELQRSLRELGEKKQAIERLRVEAAAIQESLNVTKASIEQARVEKSGNFTGRITVISYGDLPITPSTDPRRKLTVFGALGLSSAGVGLVMLMGFMDRRMRHIDSARSHLHQVERMLGVIPDLPAGMNDPDQSSSAAYCIHQIRAMLQIRQRATGHKVFAVTSPSPGDGKTSLTIALGMSLAASGQRTVVVDCDIEGASLSSKMRMRVNPETSERLVLGDLQTALRGEPLEQCIHGTGFNQLSLLPLSGSSSAAGIGRVSPEALRGVLDSLAKRYDIILVDCGPALGSIEAPIVAAEADGVVLVITRGGNRTTAEAAVRLLHSAGAEIEGIVFNRAEAADVARSAYDSSGRLRSTRSRAASSSSVRQVDSN